MDGVSVSVEELKEEEYMDVYMRTGYSPQRVGHPECRDIIGHPVFQFPFSEVTVC